MAKVTFTLDDETVELIRRLASRLGRSQSQVVRDSVKEYEVRVDKLTDEERQQLLTVVHRITKAPPTRPQAEVNAELREIRTARRRWARSPR